MICPAVAESAAAGAEENEDVTLGVAEPEMGEEKEEETTTSKSLYSPPRPTQEMIDAHMVSHLPFRTWCQACVRGRGRSIQHRQVAERHARELAGENPPYHLVSLDYSFLGDDSARAQDHPILVIRHRNSLAVWAHCVDSKGKDDFAVACVLRALKMIGCKRLMLKSDNEPAIKALTAEVIAQFDGEVVPEHNPAYIKESAGEVERSVQSVTGMIRTLRCQAEADLGIEVALGTPLQGWMVEYGATLLNLFHVGADGSSPYRRLRGRPWRIPLPVFAEAVEFRRRTASKYDLRWEIGIYLGIKEATSEKIVGNDHGIFVVQSLRRKPEGQRFDPILVQKIKGTPRNLAGDPVPVPIPVARVIPVEERVVPPVIETATISAPKILHYQGGPSEARLYQRMRGLRCVAES